MGSGQRPFAGESRRADKHLDAEFTTPTPYKSFKIFVTAERSPQVISPDGQQVLSADVSQ
jgi:hypothetical protein